MGLKEATDLYHSVIKYAGKFKSPAYNAYFRAKARDDYDKLVLDIDNGKYKCVLKKYIDETSGLKDVLKRQSVIYNMNYDRNSNI